jgi:hypothetical protein
LGRSYAAGAPNLVGVPKRAAHEIERYFSIVQRKALSPDSFDSLDALADRLLRCDGHDRQIARPFDWTFTRADLEGVLAKVTEREPRRALAAQRTEIAWPSRGSRVLPEGVDDLPSLARTHQVEVFDIDGGADGHVRDLAMHVLDLDLDAAIGDVSRSPDALRRGLDHLPRR